MTEAPKPPTPPMPEGVTPDDEIAVSWEGTDEGTRVIASLGEASVTVDCSPDGAHIVPWLIAAMPSVLEAAWDAIDNQQEEA